MLLVTNRDFAKSAQFLDTQLLNDQIDEAMRIYLAIRNSEALCMWTNYPFTLCQYGMALCDELRARNGHAHVRGFFFSDAITFHDPDKESTPLWLDDLELLESMKRIAIEEMRVEEDEPCE